MNEIFALIALGFTLFYYYTASLESCWYRRYLYPAMFAIFGFLEMGNIVIALIFFAAAYFSYHGFKGYGLEKLEEKKKSSG